MSNRSTFTPKWFRAAGVWHSDLPMATTPDTQTPETPLTPLPPLRKPAPPPNYEHTNRRNSRHRRHSRRRRTYSLDQRSRCGRRRRQWPERQPLRLSRGRPRTRRRCRRHTSWRLAQRPSIMAMAFHWVTAMATGNSGSTTYAWPGRPIPTCFLDATFVPYAVVNPIVRRNSVGVVIGCLARITTTAIRSAPWWADVSGAGDIGEISIAAATALGIDPSPVPAASPRASPSSSSGSSGANQRRNLSLLQRA